MAADQQFCLRWNNFHTNITSAFESLRDDEDFVDITLACDGRQVKAHKMVLSACSPYFRCLLKGNPCQHPIVFLKDVSYANLVSILDFMYHGEVNVSHTDLATFLKTAESLKVRGLAEDDKKRDSDCLDSSSPGPTKDGVDGVSPKPDGSIGETHLSESPPPSKRQRRRSSNSAHSAEDTNETVLSDLRESSVKNEPLDINDEDEILSRVDASDLNLKMDGCVSEENDRTYASSESVNLGRNQAAMHQLQESFGSFIPGMSQSPSFLSHSSSDISRPPFSIDGVQGLPHSLSGLPGPSMSQSSSGQDNSQELYGRMSRDNYKAAGKDEEVVYNETVPLRHPATNSYHSSSLSITKVGKNYGHQLSAAQSAPPVKKNTGDYSANKFPNDDFMAHSNPLHYGRSFANEEVKCNICGRFLCNKYVLKVHMRDVHTPRKLLDCVFCGRSYSSINSLRVHMSTNHRSYNQM